VIHAYTSNYKTGFMMAWARKMAHNIIERDWQDAVVVYVSWEDTVEEMGIYDLAHATTIDATEIQDGKLSDNEMKRLEEAAFKRGALPLWVLGNSLADRHEQPRMTLTQVREALRWLETAMSRRFVAVFLDYLNLIPPEGAHAFSDNRRTVLWKLTYRARDLSFTVGRAVIMGGNRTGSPMSASGSYRKKYDVMDRRLIEQYSHTMLSLWRPALSEIVGQPLKGRTASR
jgi:replicative DNA helicase